MQENKAIQLMKWSVIVLVICNICLLTTLWLRPGHPPGFDRPFPPPPPQNNMPPRQMDLNSRLRFTEKQEELFEQLREENEHKIDSLKKLAIAAREQFFNCLKKGASGKNEADTLALKLAMLHGQIEKQTYSHFSNIREMITDSQQVIFDAMVTDILQSLPEQPHVNNDSSEMRHGRPGMRHPHRMRPGEFRDGPPPPSMPPPGMPPPQR